MAQRIKLARKRITSRLALRLRIIESPKDFEGVAQSPRGGCRNGYRGSSGETIVRPKSRPHGQSKAGICACFRCSSFSGRRQGLVGSHGTPEFEGCGDSPIVNERGRTRGPLRMENVSAWPELAPTSQAGSLWRPFGRKVSTLSVLLSSEHGAMSGTFPWADGLRPRPPLRRSVAGRVVH